MSADSTTDSREPRCPEHGAPVVNAEVWECACKRPPTAEPATPDWLAAIEARLAARTPGEWIKALGSHNNFVVRQESRELLATITSRPDADLIAHAPADIERLLAEVRRLRLANARLLDAAGVAITILTRRAPITCLGSELDTLREALEGGA